MGRREKIVHIGQGENPSQSVRMRLARRDKNITLTEMAEQLQYSKSYLSTVENGIALPTLQLLQKYETFLGLEQGALTDDPIHEPVEALSAKDAAVRGRRRSKDCSSIRYQNRLGRCTACSCPRVAGSRHSAQYIGNMDKTKKYSPGASSGSGGIGKTTLASFVTDSIKAQFEFVYWRSLHNAPSATHILRDCLQFLLQAEPTDIPDTLNAQILLLIKCLDKHRCLLVFDNLEAIISNEETSDTTLNDDNGYCSNITRYRRGETSKLSSPHQPRETKGYRPPGS